MPTLDKNALRRLLVYAGPILLSRFPEIVRCVLSPYLIRLRLLKHYVYDGWNPIAVYSGTSLSKTYTWGMDLSGSLQGAGGVCGLLAVKEGSNSYYPTYDGNGNVSEYLDLAGSNVTHYEYDAFGNTTVSNGTKVNDFVHRFSTKQLEDESGLYYYGYRYY